MDGLTHFSGQVGFEESANTGSQDLSGHLKLLVVDVYLLFGM